MYKQNELKEKLSFRSIYIDLTFEFRPLLNSEALLNLNN